MHNGSVWTRTRTRSDGPEPLLTLLPRLESVEPGSQRLHACHRNGSLGPCLALESVAEGLAALIGLPLCLSC
jgi:hypothetical protein